MGTVGNVDSWVESFLEAAVNIQEEEDRSCMLATWQCFSGGLEQAVRHSCRPSGITSLLEEVFYRITFHGAAHTSWSSLMRMPEARHFAGCLKKTCFCCLFFLLHRLSQ